MEGLTEGRMVHYVMPSGEHRPAIVVKVWRVGQAMGPALPPENGMCNLTVFVDGRNDVKVAEVDWDPKNPDVFLMRSTSVLFSEEPKPWTWHWIEKA